MQGEFTGPPTCLVDARATAARSTGAPLSSCPGRAQNLRGRPSLESRWKSWMIIAGTPKQVIAVADPAGGDAPGIRPVGNDGTVTHEDAKTCTV
jgi:hypothetical protein